MAAIANTSCIVDSSGTALFVALGRVWPSKLIRIIGCRNSSAQGPRLWPGAAPVHEAGFHRGALEEWKPSGRGKALRLAWRTLPSADPADPAPVPSLRQHKFG